MVKKVKKKRKVTTVTRKRQVEVKQKALLADARTQVRVDKARKLGLQIEKLRKTHAKLTTDIKKYMGEKEVLVDRRKRVLATYEKHFRVYINREEFELEYPEIFHKVSYEQAVKVLRLS